MFCFFLQKNPGKPVLTPATSWMPVGQDTTTNWDLRCPTTVTMATQSWAWTPSPVSWATMESRCGTRLYLPVKVGKNIKIIKKKKHFFFRLSPKCLLLLITNSVQSNWVKLDHFPQCTWVFLPALHSGRSSLLHVVFGAWTVRSQRDSSWNHGWQ